MNDTYASEATRLHMEALIELGEIVASLVGRLGRVEQALVKLVEDESISVDTCARVLAVLAPEVSA